MNRRPGREPADSGEATAFRSEPVSRTTIPPVDLPIAWLDRLLDAMSELSSEQGPEPIVRRLLEAAVELLPEVSFGARAPEAESPASSGAEPGPDDARGPEPLLVVARARKLRPRRGSAQTSGAPARQARLFPDLPNERLFALDLPGGGALHIACHDPNALAFGRVPLFAARLASLLGFAIRTARGPADRDRLAETLPPTGRQPAGGRRSETETLRAALEQAEKLAGIGQLAAGIVHEVNSALTVIFGYAEHLRRKAEGSGLEPSDAEKLGRIAQTAERLQHFSRELIDYARPSGRGSSPLRSESVSVHEALEKALAFCAPLLGDARVAVDRRLCPGSPVVRGVEAELIHILINLITNACHAMESTGGTLTVETSTPAPAPDVALAIADSGHGIAGEHLDRVFEPFFTTKTDGRGTGLGLSVVRMLVERHGGTIAVESRRGMGTRFVIHLPLAATPG